jgi:hypothetical protein
MRDSGAGRDCVIVPTSDHQEVGFSVFGERRRLDDCHRPDCDQRRVESRPATSEVTVAEWHNRWARRSARSGSTSGADPCHGDYFCWPIQERMMREWDASNIVRGEV